MPVACGGAATLTGADGMFAYKPAGTTICLKDFTDFIKTGGKVTLSPGHGYMPGDPVTFKAEKGGKLDTGITEGTTYFLGAVTSTDAVLLSAVGGTPVAIAGDGGTGTADSTGHVKMEFAEYEAVCNIAGFDLNLTRDKIPTTSLKCSVAGGAGSTVLFKTYQAGPADGSGSMRVQFTSGSAGLASRLLADTLRAKQEGAWARFYVNAVAGAVATDLLPDDALSSYIEVPISLEGVSLAVDSAGTEATIATVNFSFAGAPTHMFNTAIG